jgi:hypothetical protein
LSQKRTDHRYEMRGLTCEGRPRKLRRAGISRQPDLPPLKWSSLKYIFRMEDEIDGKEEAYG